MNDTRVTEVKAGCCGPTCDDARAFEGLDEAAALFKALADETRLAIVRQLLEREEMCACEFEACCRLAQPTVSHHLKVLREAGLVATDKRGQWVFYRLNRDRFALLMPWLP
jgi:ArsR family transcriptional regulator